MKTNGITKVTKNLGSIISKNSPTILTGLSVAGLVTTTILAVKATPKALMILENEREYREDNDVTEPIAKMDAIKLTYKCYIPAAIMGAVTITCIVSANSISLRRNAALASVYSLTEATLKEYQSKVVETIGATKERTIKDEIAKDKITKDPVEGKEVILTGNGETLCYETISGRYFKSDIEKIRKAENKLNRDLLDDMFISLNDVFYELGLENTKMGDEVGWLTDDGMFGFDFSSQLCKGGIPCLVIDYQRTPRYDYM